MTYDTPQVSFIGDADTECESDGNPFLLYALKDMGSSGMTTSPLNAKLFCDGVDITDKATWLVEVYCVFPSVECPDAGNGIFIDKDSDGCPVWAEDQISYSFSDETDPNTTITATKGANLYVGLCEFVPGPGGDTNIYIKVTATYGAQVVESIVLVNFHRFLTCIYA